MPTDRRGAVFLSVPEGSKASLARPFRELLAPSVEGYIVSDLPLVDDAYTPEEKVDAYLDRSDAVVVFATADVHAGPDRFTRPNIVDEIGRARSKPHLRNRVCVLKQSGVTLPSNTNPAYNHLDPSDPRPAFEAALEQLVAWGFDVRAPAPDDLPAAPGPAVPATPPDLSPEAEAAARQRAVSLLPAERNTIGEPALVLVAVSLPRGALIRPSEFEDVALAEWLEREALYGTPVLERGEATRTDVHGGSLVARQSRAWVAVDEEATVVIHRALTRGRERQVVLRGIIEEELEADLHTDLAFIDRVLSRMDPAARRTHVALVAALVGSGYTAWRTRAEQAASPHAMTLNMAGRDRVVAETPIQLRAALNDERLALARDLTVLLRREARRT